MRHKVRKILESRSLVGLLFLFQLHGDRRVGLQDHRHLAQSRLGLRPQSRLLHLALRLGGLLVLAGPETAGSETLTEPIKYGQPLLGEEFQEVRLAEAVVGGGEVAILLVVDGGRHLLAMGLAGAETLVLTDDLQVVFLVLTAHQVVLHLTCHNHISIMSGNLKYI